MEEDVPILRRHEVYRPAALSTSTAPTVFANHVHGFVRLYSDNRYLATEILSYSNALATGFEPATSCSTGRQSNQTELHQQIFSCRLLEHLYTASKPIAILAPWGLYLWRDSNPQHSEPKSDASSNWATQACLSWREPHPLRTLIGPMLYLHHRTGRSLLSYLPLSHRNVLRCVAPVEAKRPPGVFNVQGLPSSR